MALELKTPTSRERSIWNAARRNYERLSRCVARVRMRLQYASMLADHATTYGVDVALATSSWHQATAASFEKVAELAEKIGIVMDAAERGELAARPTADGKDLDIVSPAPLDPKWAEFRINAGDVPGPELGIAPLIVLGIVIAVVIGGVLTVTALTESVANKLDRDVELATLEAEKKFCEDPKSEVCKTWLTKRASKPARETRSAIDYLFGKGTGKAIAGGFGVVALLGLGWWALNRSRGRRW